jgi:hypothetical protein
LAELDEIELSFSGEISLPEDIGSVEPADDIELRSDGAVT